MKSVSYRVLTNNNFKMMDSNDILKYINDNHISNAIIDGSRI